MAIQGLTLPMIDAPEGLFKREMWVQVAALGAQVPRRAVERDGLAPADGPERRRDDEQRDLDEELQSYLLLSTDEKVRAGMSPEAAARAARVCDAADSGGGGKAARNWECFDAIVATLKSLGDDETLLVQSGKPVGVFRTHDEAPRVLIANAIALPAAYLMASRFWLSNFAYRASPGVLTFLAVAGLFILQGAEFLGAVQPIAAADEATPLKLRRAICAASSRRPASRRWR